MAGQLAGSNTFPTLSVEEKNRDRAHLLKTQKANTHELLKLYNTISTFFNNLRLAFFYQHSLIYFCRWVQFSFILVEILKYLVFKIESDFQKTLTIPST